MVRISCTSASIWVSFAASADTAVHNALSSTLQVPAPAMVQEEVEDATPAHASEPAAATLTLNAVEDEMAAADVTSHDGSFEVEVQVESSSDEEDSASSAVQVNVQSANRQQQNLMQRRIPAEPPCYSCRIALPLCHL